MDLSLSLSLIYAFGLGFPFFLYICVCICMCTIVSSQLNCDSIFLYLFLLPSLHKRNRLSILMSLSLSKSQALTLTLNLLLPRSSSRLQSLFLRNFSSSSDYDLTDLSESSPSSDSLLRNLEDAIQRILVRRSAPDWLPFVPGASYWVPLPTSHLPPIANLLHTFANPLSPEQSLSTTTVRGWPSSHYFIQGAHVPSLDPEVQTTSAECDAPQHFDHEEG